MVVLSSEVLEAMRALKIPSDKVVGINKWAKADIYYKEFSENSADLGSFSSPDYEKLLELKPDTVVLSSTSRIDEVANKIKDMDPQIVVLRFDCWKPLTFFDEVRKLGYILNKKDEADEFIEFYEKMYLYLQDEVKNIPESQRPEVYLELGDTPYQTTGNKGAWHTTLEMAGGKNLFGDIDAEHFDVDSEEVIKRNPEIFVKKEYPEGGYDSDNITEMISERDIILNRAELSNVDAIKNGKVFLIDTSVFASPKFVIGTAYMAKWFHPGTFQNLDPEAFHKEYIERFQGMPYRGIYIYPSLN